MTPDINPWIAPIATVVVALITGGIAWITARRTTRVENRQVDVDHDDKILTHYNGLVATLSKRTEDLNTTLTEMEKKVKALSDELSLVRILFDDALRYIRRVRSWHVDGQAGDFPRLPSSIIHLFEER